VRTLRRLCRHRSLERGAGAPASGTRSQARQLRIRAANRVLGHYGLKLAETPGGACMLQSRTGQSALIPHLGALWPAAERLSKRSCDPLDPALIAALAERSPIGVEPMADDALIPVNLITGFLGSGKTTLLQRLLHAPGMSRTAVLINELGEVGLDHYLLERLDEATVLLKSGCLCCTIRGDLRDAIRDLYDRRERAKIPAFDRLVIETTGLADPAPIVTRLMADPVIRHHFRLGKVVTVIDALNGLANLETYEESRKQAAVADQLVVSKPISRTAAPYGGCATLSPASTPRPRSGMRRARRFMPTISSAATYTIPKGRARRCGTG
jgi:hypothetical protein